MFQLGTSVLHSPPNDAAFSTRGLQLIDIDRLAAQPTVSWLAWNKIHASICFLNLTTNEMRSVSIKKGAKFFLLTERKDFYAISIDGQVYIAEVTDEIARAYPTCFAISGKIAHGVMTSKGLLLVCDTGRLFLVNESGMLPIYNGPVSDESTAVFSGNGIVETRSLDGKLQIVTLDRTGSHLCGWSIEPTSGAAHGNEAMTNFPRLKGKASCLRIAPSVSPDAQSVVVGLATGDPNTAAVQQIGLFNGHLIGEWLLEGVESVSDVAFVPDVDQEGRLRLLAITDNLGLGRKNGGCIFYGDTSYLLSQLQGNVVTPASMFAINLLT